MGGKRRVGGQLLAAVFSKACLRTRLRRGRGSPGRALRWEKGECVVMSGRQVPVIGWTERSFRGGAGGMPKLAGHLL